MHPPQQFVMISKTYLDGISLKKDGPEITKEFASECIRENGKTFRTAATFIPKLVAKHFVTTLKVADELTYYEYIAFERRTVMKNFSETTNVFIPKEMVNKYCSSLFFEPDPTTRIYKAGIDLLPARKCIVTEDSKYESDANPCVEKNAINGDIGCQQLINA